MRYFLTICCFLIALAGSSAAATYTEPTNSTPLVYIPGGTFTMGDPSGKDPFAVKPFYLGKYEVTFAEYDQFARETKRERPDDEGWGVEFDR